MRVAVITLSDSGCAGTREDRSGPAVCTLAEKAGYEVVHTALLPDGMEPLASELKRICDNDLADLVLTTGGTGFSPTDLTPEATLSVVERPAPGIAEAMRYRSLQLTPRAMLSRAAAGIRKGTLIVNLPGSPKAVRECLEYLLPALGHGLEVLRGVRPELRTIIMCWSQQWQKGRGRMLCRVLFMGSLYGRRGDKRCEVGPRHPGAPRPLPRRPPGSIPE